MSGKRILFLVNNIRNQRYGILALSAYLKQKGHVIDYACPDPTHFGQGDKSRTRDELMVQSVLRRIRDFKPDYLAVTAMTTEIRPLMKVINGVKSILPDLYVVLGGPHPTFCSSVVEEPNIDAICRGEGEAAFAEFLNRHPEGDYLSAPNFGFFVDGESRINPLGKMMDMDTLPIPDYDLMPRINSEKFVTFTSRNCVYSCQYCFNQEYRKMYRDGGEKTIYNIYSVSRFLEELKYIKDKYTFSIFCFQDDVFPVSKEWLNEFVERYPVEIGKPFHLALNPCMIKDGTIEKLRAAGLVSLNMAIESGSERIRNDIMLRPRITNTELVRLCRTIKKNGIYINAQNMMMSPTETFEEAKSTLDLNIACGVDSAVVGKFQPFPGTRMGKLAVELGLVDSASILQRIPENYHFESILYFPEDDAIKMDNLVHIFSFCVRYPLMRPVLYKMLHMRWDWLFHRIDDQFWMTHTHRRFNSYSIANWWSELKVGAIFAWRMLFPKDKGKFSF